MELDSSTWLDSSTGLNSSTGLDSSTGLVPDVSTDTVWQNRPLFRNKYGIKQELENLYLSFYRATNSFLMFRCFSPYGC
jgi:hypothetical protein